MVVRSMFGLVVLVALVACGASSAGAQAGSLSVADSVADSATDSIATQAPASPALPGPATRAWQLGLARPDRIQHLSLSLTVGLGAGLISRRAASAAAGSVACGLAKELYDIPRTGFDMIDLVADLIGAAAATAISAAVLDD